MRKLTKIELINKLKRAQAIMIGMGITILGLCATIGTLIAHQLIQG